MSKRFALFATAAVLAFGANLALGTMASVPAYAQQMSDKTVMVGGAPMYPSKNIIQNAVNSKDHTTLVAAVKAAGLVDTLEGPGPFTVFAPTNAAFAKLPDDFIGPHSLPGPSVGLERKPAAGRGILEQAVGLIVMPQQRLHFRE